MVITNILMIAGGLLMVAVGFGAVHCRSGVQQKLGALCLPLGLLLALSGILLLCVPGFFFPQ